MVSKVVYCSFEKLFSLPLRNGLTRPTAVRGEGVKMINMGEIFAHSRISNISMERVPLSPEEAEKYLLSSGDLLFARQSLVLSGAGKCSIFKGDPEPVTFEGHLIRARLNGAVADSDFYFYFFNSLVGRQSIESIVEQVAAAGIRASDLSKLLVPHPPLPEQRAIARILSSLDDKIELNRRMNVTLEETVRAIFKSWFVDFDPVRAKVEGRQPTNMDAGVTALFPDAFEVIEGREVPKGWRVEPIGDLVTIVGGSTPSTTEAAYWEGGTISWATPKDLSSLTTSILLDTERRITEKGLSRIGSGLLPQGTVLLSSRAPIGYLAISDIPVAVNQGFIAMICNKQLSKHYVLQWGRINLEEIIGRANGTTFLEISKANFRPILGLLPAEDALETFVSIAESIYQKVRANLQQSRTLTTLRDTLLPKLLSGDLRVQDAERWVETAM